MRVSPGTIVSFKYQLLHGGVDVTKQGLIGPYASSTATDTVIIGKTEIFSKVEAALMGLTEGASLQINLSADEAYGARDEEAVVQESLSDLPSGTETKVGDWLELSPPDDDEECAPVYFRITQIADGMATLDANHPLAGMDLVMTLEVLEIDAAPGVDLTEVLLLPEAGDRPEYGLSDYYKKAHIDVCSDDKQQWRGLYDDKPVTESFATRAEARSALLTWVANRRHPA